MVGHRSTGLPECGPTESSAPEPCCFYIYVTETHLLDFMVGHLLSWLATEVQFCRNVGRPNPRRPNLVVLNLWSSPEMPVKIKLVVIFLCFFKIYSLLSRLQNCHGPYFSQKRATIFFFHKRQKKLRLQHCCYSVWDMAKSQSHSTMKRKYFLIWLHYYYGAWDIISIGTFMLKVLR